MRLIKYSAFIALLLVVVGCSTSTLIATQKSMPAVYEDVNDTHEEKKSIKISLFRLNNYTDTPRAGMRASNLVEGVLRARGYDITSHLKDKLPSMKKARKIAKSDGSKFFMYGGVSEWRYKTGIDGEPAVSLQLSLYKVKNKKLVWSSTASDSDWGNASIGTTAQDLIDEMLSN